MDTGTPLSRAASHALSKTHALLLLTHTASRALPAEDRTETDEERDVREPMRKVRRMRGRELRLVQGQDIIRRSEKVEARRLEPWAGFWDEDELMLSFGEASGGYVVHSPPEPGQ